jgi:hypothetical protein
MKVKLRHKYYCDFCKVTKGQKYAMEKHEASCTKNPNRICKGSCTWNGGQKKMADLLAVIGPVRDYQREQASLSGGVFYTFESDPINEMLPRLRYAATDCPFCIMAALRQAGIPVPEATDFDYKKEVAELHESMNESRLCDV